MNKQATLLAVDTSTATMAGAIMSGDKLLASVQTESERNHSIHIMTNIEAMMKASKLDVNELDGIIAGIGPGSYTGVRIAVTAAKTLAWTCRKPLIGVSSLAALAFSGVFVEKQQLDHTVVLPIMDARRGQVYTAAFEINAASAQSRRLHQDHIVLMEQWCQLWEVQLAELKARGVSCIAIFGDVALHADAISSLEQTAAQYGIAVLAAAHAMSGRALAELGQGQWLEERIMPTEPHELVPNYAQLTEAEVKQNAKEREEG